MTADKTPLDEFLAAVTAHLPPGHQAIAIKPEALEDRTQLIKAIWQSAVANAPADAFEGGNGLLLEVGDPTQPGTMIRYDIIAYGDKRVVEAEGVIVCHLLK